VVPLATHSAVATVDPRKVIATIRGTEVAADPTNALALEAAHRRSSALAGHPGSAAPIRLATSQRVTRAQHFDPVPGRSAHFQLFALVSAGRDTGDLRFEKEHLAEHLVFAVRAIAATGADDVRVRLTCLNEQFAPVAAHARAALAEVPDATVIDDPDRLTGRGYYIGLCYKIHATVRGNPHEIGDGGFVDWTRKLLSSQKERLLITGLGLDLLA
jgi:hypothetical protein